MSQVGSGFGTFQGTAILNKKPINPYDKTTIVSIYPKVINEQFVTVYPCAFEIPAAPMNGFSLLTVGPSSAWRFMSPEEPYLEIQISSFEIANAIVTKFAQGLLDCNMADRMPGLFVVPGEFDSVSINSFPTFKTSLAAAKIKQENWFKQLVKTSDVLWARTNGNPLAIAEDARLAAELLQLDKPWMKDAKAFELRNCVACGHMINPAFPVCPNCKNVVDKAKAKELGLTFAQ